MQEVSLGGGRILDKGYYFFDISSPMIDVNVIIRSYGSEFLNLLKDNHWDFEYAQKEKATRAPDCLCCASGLRILKADSLFFLGLCPF